MSLARTLLPSLLVCGSISCSLFAGNMPPPSVEEPVQIVQRETLRLQQITTVLKRDLDLLTRVQQDFFALQPGSYASPSFLPLFKQVAMSCLIEPYQKEAPPQSDPIPEQLEALEPAIICRPDALPVFLERLEESPSPEKTLLQLQRIDQIRRLMGKLRDRIAQIPIILRRERALLANQRSQLRQLREETSRQRKEFDEEGWELSLDRLQSYESELERLDDAIQSLAHRSEVWPATLRESLETFTLELTAIHLAPPSPY